MWCTDQMGAGPEGGGGYGEMGAGPDVGQAREE